MTNLEIRCPRCDGLLTPDQISRARPTADCTFCNMAVLVKRPEPVPETPPIPMPHGFEVTETAAPKPDAPVQAGGDPYRDPGSQALALRPGLSITWTEDNFYLRLSLVLVNIFTWGWSVTCWCLLILGGPLKLIPAALFTTFLGGFFALGTRTTWPNARWVRADHEGLHWHRYRLTARRETALLPASEIAQLFVRDKTDRDPDAVVIPNFVLYARDHRGRDHSIVHVEDPEQAWWLEARLEQHLGIVNRRVEGEHRREPPLLPEPPAQ